MSGIYGETLLAFPEQYQTITVYGMTPRVNGGWDMILNSSQNVTGIIQNTTANNIKEGNGNLVKTGGLELWTRTGQLDGKFTQYENTVYRIQGSNNWDRQAGFFRYSLQKVVGNNGTESDNATFNLGGNSLG